MLAFTVAQLLYAYGDDQEPLPETVRVLDAIVTDFVIENCHQAAQVATYAGRQKVKLDDFRFVMRKDAIKLEWRLRRRWAAWTLWRMRVGRRRRRGEARGRRERQMSESGVPESEEGMRGWFIPSA